MEMAAVEAAAATAAAAAAAAEADEMAAATATVAEIGWRKRSRVYVDFFPPPPRSVNFERLTVTAPSSPPGEPLICPVNLGGNYWC